MKIKLVSVDTVERERELYFTKIILKEVLFSNSFRCAYNISRKMGVLCLYENTG